MDVKEIEEFLKSLQMSIPKLRKAFDWELEFFIERAKELNIKGMEEFLREKTGRDFHNVKEQVIKRGRPPKRLNEKAGGKKTDKPKKASVISTRTIQSSRNKQEDVTVISTDDSMVVPAKEVTIKLIERLTNHRIVGSAIKELLTMDKYISKSAVSELEKELYNTILLENYLEGVVREITGRDV